MAYPIFTNNALSAMSKHGLSEAGVMDAYNKGEVEKWAGGFKSVRKYNDYEIGATWVQNPDGKVLITSAWKRTNRR